MSVNILSPSLPCPKVRLKFIVFARVLLFLQGASSQVTGLLIAKSLVISVWSVVPYILVFTFICISSLVELTAPGKTPSQEPSGGVNFLPKYIA